MSIRLGSFIDAAAAHPAAAAKRPSRSSAPTVTPGPAFQGQKSRLMVPMAARPGVREPGAAA